MRSTSSKTHLRFLLQCIGIKVIIIVHVWLFPPEELKLMLIFCTNRKPRRITGEIMAYHISKIFTKQSVNFVGRSSRFSRRTQEFPSQESKCWWNYKGFRFKNDRQTYSVYNSFKLVRHSDYSS